MWLRVFILWIVLDSSFAEDIDPYGTLNVRRGASQEEIRKAYKNLAREWHPDKNTDPTAGEKFMKINQAYEILGDEKKRQEYDQNGKISDEQKPNWGQGQQFFRTPFGTFQFHDGPSFSKYRITERQLQSEILPESHKKPYVFFATTDFCFSCMRIQPIWDQFVPDLEAVGIGVGTIDVDYDSNVARRLRVPRVPCVGAIIEGKSIIFDTDEYSVRLLREFARKLIPSDLVLRVTPGNIDKFLQGWSDNKVRALFFDSSPLPSLRVTVAAFKLRSRILLGYVDLSSADSSTLAERYDVPMSGETLLILKEEDDPIHAVSRTKLEESDIEEVLSTYKYLTLPRLADEQMYNNLCPPSTGKTYKSFCLVLTFPSTLLHTPEVQTFRRIAKSNSQQKAIIFMYAFSDKQTSIMTAWKRPIGNYQVLILLRKPENEVFYEWLDWSVESESHMRELLDKLLSRGFIPNARSVQRYEIRNEFQASLLKRIFRRLYDWWDYFTYNFFDGDHSLTIVSVLSTIVCIIIMTVLLTMMSRPPPRSELEEKMARSPFTAATELARRDPTSMGQFTILELRHHNYSELVKESPSGYRLILLLVDQENKERFVKRFGELMLPFSRTPYFRFAFLYIDRYLIWYRRILQLSVGEKEAFDHLIVSHCVGTVLAINGFRKYYNVYHPKTLAMRSNGAMGDFIGLEDSSSEDELLNGNSLNSHEHALPNAELLLRSGCILDGLGHWIDRLFDGSLTKCKVDRWPVFPADPIEEKKDQ